MWTCVSSQSLHRVLARVLVALLLPLLGCESPRFMPHLTEVQPPLDQYDTVKSAEGSNEEPGDPVVSNEEVMDAAKNAAQPSSRMIERDEALSAEDMLKLMVQSERAATVGKGLDTQLMDQEVPLIRDGPIILEREEVIVRSAGPVRNIIALLVLSVDAAHNWVRQC